MIKASAYAVEPWALRETSFDPELLAASESLFALSNGHLGLRGNLDEGEPHGLPGTYLNGFYEQRRLPYAEAGYGYPEDGHGSCRSMEADVRRVSPDPSRADRSPVRGVRRRT